MTAAEALRAAAELLSKPGAWTQGAYALDAHGLLASPTSEQAVCWCMLGALRRVVRARGVRHTAIKALSWHTKGNIVLWQDARGRTQAEVVAALRAAAERAEKARS